MGHRIWGAETGSLFSRMSSLLQHDRRVTLGATSESLFPVGQGTNGFGSRTVHDLAVVRARQASILAGIDCGITFVDTAELYGAGFAEECLAPVLAGRRDSVFLATKFNAKIANTQAEIQHSIDGSLRRMKTDHVDLLQVHFPNPAISEDELFDGMRQIIQQGKARHLGISNFSVEEAARAKIALGDHLVSLQVEYNPYDRSAELDLIPWSAAHSVTVLAYSPLGNGRLNFASTADSELTQLAQRYGCTLHQVVLGWVLRHTHVVGLTKSSSPVHQAENAAAARMRLELGDMAVLDKHLNFPKTYSLPEKITPDSGKNRPTYRTLDEANRNELQLVPSPADLAALLRAGHQAKPIKLQPLAEPEGKYLLQPFDHFGELRKYWAWIMVHGWSTPMPSIIAP